MTKSIQDIFDDYQACRTKETATRAVLHDACAPDIIDLTFRKQNRTAVVFTGQLDGAQVFLKHYKTDFGPTLVRKSVEETEVVQRYMNRQVAGVADIVWSNEAAGLVIMAAVPGTPVSDALSAGQAVQVMPQVALWLAQYIGPRSFDDKFNPNYWINSRAKEDTAALSAPDRDRFARLLDVQRMRNRGHGTMPARKGHYPKDFAPHNMHWTGTGVWGFDIEGYKSAPIARAIARFCVSATWRLPARDARQFGVHSVCLNAFGNAIDLSGDPPDLMPFVIADEMLYSLLRRHDDPVVGPKLRIAIDAHLAAG